MPYTVVYCAVLCLRQCCIYYTAGIYIYKILLSLVCVQPTQTRETTNDRRDRGHTERPLCSISLERYTAQRYIDVLYGTVRIKCTVNRVLYQMYIISISKYTYTAVQCVFALWAAQTPRIKIQSEWNFLFRSSCSNTYIYMYIFCPGYKMTVRDGERDSLSEISHPLRPSKSAKHLCRGFFA